MRLKMEKERVEKEEEEEAWHAGCPILKISKCSNRDKGE